MIQWHNDRAAWVLRALAPEPRLPTRAKPRVCGWAKCGLPVTPPRRYCNVMHRTRAEHDRNGLARFRRNARRKRGETDALD